MNLRQLLRANGAICNFARAARNKRNYACVKDGVTDDDAILRAGPFFARPATTFAPFTLYFTSRDHPREAERERGASGVTFIWSRRLSLSVARRKCILLTFRCEICPSYAPLARILEYGCALRNYRPSWSYFHQ